MEKLLGWIETEDLYNTIEDLKIIFLSHKFEVLIGLLDGEVAFVHVKNLIFAL